MSIELLTLVMFSSLIVLLTIGVPLAFTLGGLAVIVGFSLMGPDILTFIVYRIWSLSQSFSFIAIPLFVFMANMLRYSGIAEDLYEAVHTWLGPVRGGLASASVIACTVMAAMLGVAGAAVAVMGLIALPEMLKRNYSKDLALGSIVAGGSLGVLIPPSILFIIYAQFAQQSVGKLFMGGVIPGLILSGLFILYISIRCFFQPDAGPAKAKEERIVPFLQKVSLLRALIMPISLILAVMGTIFFGLATPSEAAGIGAFGVMVCAALRRQFNWQNLKLAVYGTIKACATIFWICFAAYAFVGVYLHAGGDKFIESIVLGLPLGRWGILIVVQLALIVLGMFLDWVGILVLVVPILVPIIVSLGFNPLWFGVLFNVNMQISYLSPPFGYSLFFLKGVAPPEITMTDLYRCAWPFIGLQMIGLALCMMFPQVVLWLPNMMIK